MKTYSLKELRARENLTQEEIAKKFGIATQTYNAWEKDISKVAVGKVKVIADYFGVSVDEIFLPNYMKNIHIGKRKN